MRKFKKNFLNGQIMSMIPDIITYKIKNLSKKYNYGGFLHGKEKHL